MLRVDGLVASPRGGTRADLAGLPGVARISDVAPGSAGRAAPLEALLAAADPDRGADHGTVESDDGLYRASIPLRDLRESGWVIFETDGAALPRDSGGPFRVVIRAGRTLCWNVKSAMLIRLTEGSEPDSVSENPPH
jgi:DMSO/TMAO reductase YedYZ molybdopterin-dependent catalytic subunit